MLDIFLSSSLCFSRSAGNSRSNSRENERDVHCDIKASPAVVFPVSIQQRFAWYLQVVAFISYPKNVKGTLSISQSNLCDFRERKIDCVHPYLISDIFFLRICRIEFILGRSNEVGGLSSWLLLSNSKVQLDVVRLTIVCIMATSGKLLQRPRQGGEKKKRYEELTFPPRDAAVFEVQSESPSHTRKTHRRSWKRWRQIR